MEMDLISPQQGADILYEKFGIPEERRQKTELLQNRPSQIKDSSVLLHVIDNLPNGSLPRSLQRIRKLIIQAIK